MRDFLPADVVRRDYVISRIRAAYESHGFVPLETPSLERIDVLTAKYGDEGDSLIFRVLKRRDALPPLTPETPPDALVDLALRYDLTVPFARVMAEHQHRLPRYFRRYQIQPVWRADRPQKGRFREFYQCDVDYVGTTSLLAEHAVMTAVSDALAALRFDAFTVRLNDRRILSGLMEAAGVPAALHGETLVAIDKLDKIGAEGVARELRERGLDDASIERLQPALRLANPGAEASAAPVAGAATLDELDALFADGRSERGAEGVASLRSLLALLADAPLPAGRVLIDVSLARGLGYYTGTIFEIAVDGLAGSMGGGGRYDELVGMFRGQPIPAVGFSLGLERLLVVLDERGMLPELRPGAALLVAPMDDVATGPALRLATQLRAAGISCEVHPEVQKPARIFKYAESAGLRHVALLGTREIDEGIVALKDLVTGEQVALARDDAPNELRSRLASAHG